MVVSGSRSRSAANAILQLVRKLVVMQQVQAPDRRTNGVRDELRALERLPAFTSTGSLLALAVVHRW
jgi:hypothetical protein